MARRAAAGQHDTGRKPNRASERITAIASVALVVGLAPGGYVALTLTESSANSISNGLQEPIVQNALSATFCSDYASFVLERSDEGLTRQQIEDVWKAANPKLRQVEETDVDDVPVPCAGACGSIDSILAAAGRG